MEKKKDSIHRNDYFCYSVCLQRYTLLTYVKFDSLIWQNHLLFERKLEGIAIYYSVLKCQHLHFYRHYAYSEICNTQLLSHIII